VCEGGRGREGKGQGEKMGGEGEERESRGRERDGWRATPFMDPRYAPAYNYRFKAL